MKIIDISWPLTKTSTTYKNANNVFLEKIKLFEKNSVRESQLNISSHTGTHIDSPAHFLENGHTTEKINLESLIGPCTVFDFTNITEKITAHDLQKIKIKQNSIILFKTKNSILGPEENFNHNFIYLEKSAAQFLTDKKIKSVGFDYLGIERNQPNHETHKLLLSNNVLIIEGLRLKHVEPGDYELYCLPLKVVGLEAAPARAVLVKGK
jgi:arylformamidase